MRSSASTRWMASALLVAAAVIDPAPAEHLRAATPARRSQTPAVPPLRVNVTVSAESARRIRGAVQALKRSDDPFLAKIAEEVEDLANALAAAAPGRVFTAGPLIDTERLIDLDGAFSDFHNPEGTIRFRVMSTWTEAAPRVYTLNQADLLSMMAAMAKGPFVQVPLVQQRQVLFVGRMILDLNYQIGGVIPHEDVLAALAEVFENKDTGRRMVGIIEAMADDRIVYDLVPPSQLAEFRRRAEPGFIIPAAEGQPEAIRLRYGESLYRMRADDLIWSCLRFFAGDNSVDWVAREEARNRASLGRAVLSYLDAQVRLHAVGDLWIALASNPPGHDAPLGTYRAGGPVMVFLADAPGIERKKVKGASNRLVLSVRAAKVEQLKRWLERAAGEVERDLDSFH